MSCKGRNAQVIKGGMYIDIGGAAMEGWDGKVLETTRTILKKIQEMKIAMTPSYKCHTFCMMKLPLKHHSPMRELFSGAPTCLSAAFEPLQSPDGAVFATAAIPPHAPSVVPLTSADVVP